MNINKIFLTFRIDKEEGLFGQSPMRTILAGLVWTKSKFYEIKQV